MNKTDLVPLRITTETFLGLLTPFGESFNFAGTIVHLAKVDTQAPHQELLLPRALYDEMASLAQDTGLSLEDILKRLIPELTKRNLVRNQHLN